MISHRESARVSGKSEVISSGRFLIEDGILQIRSVAGNDKGEYECRASNSLGEIRRKISLSLTGNLGNRGFRSELTVGILK